MKKLLFVFVTMFICSFMSFAEDNQYLIDNDAIENVFSQATEISLQDINLFTQENMSLMSGVKGGVSMARSSSVNPWVAFAICTIIGDFGIHRHYLGTSKAMWAYYTFTCCGIFGIVPFVDWIVLLVGALQDDIKGYEDNENFFMWI